MRLPMQDHRIDCPSDIVDRCIPFQGQVSRLRIDLDFANVAAVGKSSLLEEVIGDGG